MAKYRSIVTDQGLLALSNYMLIDKKLIIDFALAGSGRYEDTQDKTKVLALKSASPVEANISDFKVIVGDPSLIRISVQVTNANLTINTPIRELGLYCKNKVGNSILFAYSWLDGEDTDNILPASDGDLADTVHVHDMALIISNQEIDCLDVPMGAGTFITHKDMITFAAPLDHKHKAKEINESIGEDTETVQRRQDSDIEDLKLKFGQMLSKETVVHTYKEVEWPDWKGYEGEGLPEGIYDPKTGILCIN